MKSLQILMVLAMVGMVMPGYFIDAKSKFDGYAESGVTKTGHCLASEQVQNVQFNPPCICGEPCSSFILEDCVATGQGNYYNESLDRGICNPGQSCSNQSIQQAALSGAIAISVEPCTLTHYAH